LITFINNELPSRYVNTLIIRIDYHYQFKSHPELVDTLALSYDDVKKIVKASRKNDIRLIPQINLLGHQSWANKPGKLLRTYPQFDETPWLVMPEKYEWPNSDSLYCKSYCPLHPEIHKILFDIIDELCDAFGSSAFHAGMDEVFILADTKCERCAGKSKSELFAGEVTAIRNHLADKKKELWIWGDRLLDGRTTGVGMWEGSFNDTHPAIDLIPKDVVICDWHYERADKTAVYFAQKGFRVITCPWRRPDVAVQQLNDMVQYRKEADPTLRKKYLGVMQTVWSSTSSFLSGYYGINTSNPNEQQPDSVNTAWNTLRSLSEKIDTLQSSRSR
jgi:N-acetyl-beta-hexosaminidase